MTFGGINIFNSFEMSNWCMPSFTPYNPFMYSMASYQPPIFNFTNPNVWNFIPSAPIFNTSSVMSSAEDNNDFSKTSYDNDGKGALADYDAEAGEKLANVALKNHRGWTGWCAKYVKNAISKANLGAYKFGHAYQMTSILRDNKNFKEIPVDEVDVSDLPAGCVLVYNKGSQGYSKRYGHTEITTGDGRAVSDGITQHLHKKPSAIFMPVEHSYYA